MTIIEKNIQTWLKGNYDEETKNTIQQLQRENVKELEDAFYTNLEFGTGGLRGIMGVGTNRMNKYTVGMATQGLANYLLSQFKNETIKVGIAFDSRNNSKTFAQLVANIFSANGIHVYLFPELRPTPELSFAIRKFNFHSGVVCTASHNPKEYNGYKVYWQGGAQIVEPHDKNILKAINDIDNIDKIKWQGNPNLIKTLGKDVDEDYINTIIKDYVLSPQEIKKYADIKIVYTPIHGTGVTIIPQLLQKIGFKNVTVVEEQAEPNGNFPTVKYPNPEEQETMTIGLKKAQQLNADILIGTDPDTDRIGIGIQNDKNEWILLNGNQTALLAFSYFIERRKELQLSKPNDFIVKTIVTTELIDVIAEKNNITCYNTYTGFKWIASLIKEKEPQEKFIIGGEESFGLMIGDHVRDKDAATATAVVCDMMAYYKSKGLTLFEQLLNIYQTYGFYYEELLSITKKGMDGKEQIANMMKNLRHNLPIAVAGKPIIYVADYQTQTLTNIITKQTTSLNYPPSNTLQLTLSDGSKISARPSGTEPKIKFYFSIQIADYTNYHLAVNKASAYIKQIIQDLNLA